MNVDTIMDKLNNIEEKIKIIKFKHTIYPSNEYIIKSGVERLNWMIKDLNDEVNKGV